MRDLLFVLISAALIALLYVQTDIGWLTMQATIDLVAGECEIYLNKDRDVWHATCSRHP